MFGHVDFSRLVRFNIKEGNKASAVVGMVGFDSQEISIINPLL